MTGLALLFTHFYVLAVIEVNVIGKVMDLGPLYFVCAIRKAICIFIRIVGLGIRIITGISINLLNYLLMPL